MSFVSLSPPFLAFSLSLFVGGKRISRIKRADDCMYRQKMVGGYLILARINLWTGSNHGMIIDFDHCRTHADSVLHSVHSKQYQLLKRELLVAYGEMIGSSDSEKGESEMG